jgi:hypothetical protein
VIAADTGAGLDVVVLTFIGTFAGLLAAGAVLWPIYQRRVSRREAHERRIEATCDAVLGIEADTNLGRQFKPGLVHVIPLNGYKRHDIQTVMDRITETKNIAEAAQRAADRGP